MLSPAARAAILQALARYLAERPGEEKRLQKAVALVYGGAVSPCQDSSTGEVFVRSQKTKNPYRVGKSTCPCRDSQKGRACKHRLARRLYWIGRAAEDRAEQEERRPRGTYDAAAFVRSGAHAASVLAHESRAYAERDIDYSAAQEAPEDEPAYDAWDLDAEAPSEPPLASPALRREEDLYARAAKARRSLTRARRAAEEAARLAREEEQEKLLAAWRKSAPEIFH